MGLWMSGQWSYWWLEHLSLLLLYCCFLFHCLAFIHKDHKNLEAYLCFLIWSGSLFPVCSWIRYELYILSHSFTVCMHQGSKVGNISGVHYHSSFSDSCLFHYCSISFHGQIMHVHAAVIISRNDIFPKSHDSFNMSQLCLCCICNKETCDWTKPMVSA